MFGMSSVTGNSADRAVLRQHAERAANDEAFSFLEQGVVADVAFVIDSQPFALPMTYQFSASEPNVLYLHGGTNSRMLRHLASGAPVCVTVTIVDGLVYSRSALYHSVNYRSAVVFGTASPITDRSEKARILEKMIARYYPGRTRGHDYEAATDAQLDATAVLAIKIEQVSGKKRVGPPTGPKDALQDAKGSCGVVPMNTAVPRP